MKRRALNGVDNTGDYASSVQQQHYQQQQNSIADRRRRLDNMYAKLEDLKG